MTTGAQIREAGDGDAEAVAAVLNWAIRETDTTFRSTLRSAEEIVGELRSKRVAGYPYLVGLLDGRIVGLATYSQFRANEGYRHTMEHSIILLPEAQGRGIGRQLMNSVSMYARERGVHSLMAGVSGANPNGVAFHAALGFETVGCLPEVGFKNGVWLDLVVMQLRL